MSQFTKRDRTGGSRDHGLIVVALIILAGACSAMPGDAVYSSPVTNREFEGTWRAEYQGKSFMILALSQEKGKLSGTVRMMDMHINLEGGGEIDDVSGELSDPKKLTNLRLDGKALFFDMTEEGDTDAVHWRMELISPGKASLQWVELPKGLKAQPIPLVKDVAGH